MLDNDGGSPDCPGLLGKRVPHFGHFKRFPSAPGGSVRTTPHWGHCVVDGMIEREELGKRV
jgi:hypothetical protein